MSLMARRRALMMAKESGPVENFDRVGDPTIINGILTPSETSWIKSKTSFQPGSNMWEIVFRIKRYNTNGYQDIFFSDGILIQAYGASAKLYLKEINGSSYNICNGTAERSIALNSILYVRIAFDGNKYYFGTSSDGVTYSNVTVTSSKKISTGKIQLGYKASNTVYVHANYYLDDTYVKIGDTVWWTPYI